MGSKPLRKLPVWALLLPFAVLLCAQTPDRTAKPEEPSIRVATRLVQLNVIVQDKEGQPVADLAREDFTVLDEGKPQKVALFSVESARPLPRPSQPLPPNTYTNRFERRGEVQTSITVILLDGLNTRFHDQGYAKKQIVKFLEQTHPEDHIALYLLASELRILHDFTTDAGPLLRALARYKGIVSPELAASEPIEITVEPGLRDEEGRVDHEIDELVRSQFQKVQDFYITRRIELTVRALESIAHHVARFPGRKNLLWVSASFPLAIATDAVGMASRGRQLRVFSDEVNRATRALSDANVAVYPIDARGLVGVPALDASKQAVDGLDLDTGILDKTMWSDEVASTIASMKTLAERTGGRAFWNSNDILTAIRSAVDDCRVIYVLGYYPTDNRWDGRFRQIKVKLRRPVLRVQHRSGYYAYSEEVLTKGDVRSRLDDAAWSPIEATALGLLVRVAPEQTAEGTWLNLFLAIDPRDVALRRQGDRWVGALDLLFVQPDTQGLDLRGQAADLELSLKQESYQEIQRQGLTLSQRVKLEPDAHQLRVVVRDRTSGALGSVVIPLSQFLRAQGSQ